MPSRLTDQINFAFPPLKSASIFALTGQVPYQYLTCPVSAAGIGSEGPTVVGLRFMDLVGLLLLTTEPRAGGGATGGEDYVAVGIETLDC